MPLYKNGHVFNLLFYCHIILFWEKVISYEELNHNFALEVLSGKFQHFIAIDGSIEMLKTSWVSRKFQFKWKIKKEVQVPQTGSTPKEIILPPPPLIPLDKISSLEEKLSFTENIQTCTKIYRKIYRNIQTFAFKVIQECNSWMSRSGPVQMFFLTPNRSTLAGKSVK